MAKVTSTKGEYRTYDAPEEWRDVVGAVAGWPYKVSNWGRVMSCHTFHGRPPRLHSVRVTHDGYQYVKLRCDGAVLFTKVHLLVIEAFIGTRPTGLVANHKDRDRQNNQPENLEWVTPQENVRHGNRLSGRVPKTRKLTDDQIRQIREQHASGITCWKMSKLYPVTETCLRSIVNRKTYANVL